MSGKRRIVPVLVDDERVTHLSVAPLEQTTPDSEGRSNYLSLLGHSRVPVPPDDQLTRDLHRLTNMVLNPEAYAMASPEKTREAAARLRAWFELDGESE